MILLFQCVFDMRHNGGNKIGKIWSRFSSINCTTYSFDHNAKDRSATCTKLDRWIRTKIDDLLGNVMKLLNEWFVWKVEHRHFWTLENRLYRESLPIHWEREPRTKGEWIDSEEKKRRNLLELLSSNTFLAKISINLWWLLRRALLLSPWIERHNRLTREKDKYLDQRSSRVHRCYLWMKQTQWMSFVQWDENTFKKDFVFFF